MAGYTLLYSSKNLSGHTVADECNPGGGSSCPCSSLDVSLNSFDDYGAVTSNPREVNTWVNAVGYKKFLETFPNEQSISLAKYKYTGEFRLSGTPVPDVTQRNNPQAIHAMIQFWDGRNALMNSNKTTREGAIYWDLNPWTPDYGKIKVYVKPVTLTATEIVVTPDLQWHSFELVIDIIAERYVSITIDNQAKDLSDLELARVTHNDWGNEVAMNITTESMATFPQGACSSIFTWTTDFRNIEFSYQIN